MALLTFAENPLGRPPEIFSATPKASRTPFGISIAIDEAPIRPNCQILCIPLLVATA